MTLSLIPKLVWQIYTVEGLRMGVPAGSRIRAGAELVELTRGPNGAQATVRVTVERDGGDRPVCVAETISLLAD